MPRVTTEAEPIRDGVDAVFLLLKKTINILGAILIIPVITLCLIMVVYVAVLLVPDGQINRDAPEKIQTLVSSLWERLIPISTQIIKILSPVFVLILAITGINLVNRGDGRAIRFNEILSDLPSVLATIIVITICLIPFTGGEIPQVLNNVALVVVGFYFGKVQRRSNSTQGQSSTGAGGTA